MNRCPYCQNIIDSLIAFSLMEVKQRVDVVEGTTPGEDYLDWCASEDVEGSEVRVDYQCPECKATLFRSYDTVRPSAEVEGEIIDFLTGHRVALRRMPTDEDLSRVAINISADQTEGRVLSLLAEAWLGADIALRGAMRNCFEETLLRLGKLEIKVIGE